jgi:hypothetical protein
MRRLVLFVGAVLLARLGSARADSISVNFESPDYHTGSIDTQQGWGGQNPPGIPINGSIIQGVTNTGACSGTQSYHESSSVTENAFGDQVFSPSLVDSAGESGAIGGACSTTTTQGCAVDGDCPVSETCLVFAGGTRQSRFTATVHFRSVTTTSQDSHVVISPDRGDGARMSWIQVSDNVANPLACKGGDANGESCATLADCPNTTTNDSTAGCNSSVCMCAPDGRSGLSVSFYDYRTPAHPFTDCLDGAVNGVDGQGKCFVFAVLATNLSRTTCHEFDLTMEFYDGEANDVVRVSVDGGAPFTGTSWEDYFRNNQNPPFSAPPPVDSLLFRVAGTAEGNSSDGFLFDDVSYASGQCQAATRFVTTSGNDTFNDRHDNTQPCKTVQHAVDVACSGDTVQVGAGPFAEQVHIPKDLTVIGAGAGHGHPGTGDAAGGG